MTYKDLRGYPIKYSPLIHRQIAYSEIYLKNRDKYPKPFGEYIIHHIDTNKENFSVDNLFICTKNQHNRIHDEQKRRKQKFKNSKEINAFLNKPQKKLSSEPKKKKKNEREKEERYDLIFPKVEDKWFIKKQMKRQKELRKEEREIRETEEKKRIEKKKKEEVERKKEVGKEIVRKKRLQKLKKERLEEKRKNKKRKKIILIISLILIGLIGLYLFNNAGFLFNFSNSYPSITEEYYPNITEEYYQKILERTKVLAIEGPCHVCKLAFEEKNVVSCSGLIEYGFLGCCFEEGYFNKQRSKLHYVDIFTLKEISLEGVEKRRVLWKEFLNNR